MSKLLVKRFAKGEDSTGGLLFFNGEFQCYTCEDEHREVKVAGETRIPAGTYTLALRDAGGMNKKYAQRYTNHNGMLHLLDVPNFSWVYIHTGNDDDDTEGCILVGETCNTVNGEFSVTGSRRAYTALYSKILTAMENGETVEVEVQDEESC